MFELINRYAQLKVLEDERRDRLNDAKFDYQVRVKMIKESYPDLDQEMQGTRKEIQGEVTAIGGTYFDSIGKVEIQNRVSWEIVNPYNLREWLEEQGKDEFYDFTFKKAEINKICTGLDLAGMDLPDGTEKVETPTLVITLPKHDTEPQAV